MMISFQKMYCEAQSNASFFFFSRQGSASYLSNCNKLPFAVLLVESQSPQNLMCWSMCSDFLSSSQFSFKTHFQGLLKGLILSLRGVMAWPSMRGASDS